MHNASTYAVAAVRKGTVRRGGARERTTVAPGGSKTAPLLLLDADGVEVGVVVVEGGQGECVLAPGS